MNNLLSVLNSTLKARITPIWTKLRYWTSPSFIRARVLTKIRSALSNIFHIKPRHKNDYYPFFRYLISKRLAHAIVIVVGILCLCYFVWINPVVNIKEGLTSGEKIYSYNSLPLRFAKGQVKIKAKAGYVAYDGNVEKGSVTGYGQLFNKDGGLVYKGNFEKNEYSGQGVLYYPIGQVEYEGQFQNNLFNGEGRLYRENGTKHYEGAFSNGVFEGEGTLYNVSDTAVFQGSFHNGEIVYSQLLGKSVSDIAGMYTGASQIYQKDTDWAVIMDDIDAFYVAGAVENSIEDDTKTSAIYVGKEEFVYGDSRITTIEELKNVMGTPLFEGNSYVTFPEAVGINWLTRQGKDLPFEITMETTAPYEEVRIVDSYQTDALIYLYVFQVEDITYTFFATDRNAGFFMYELEQ